MVPRKLKRLTKSLRYLVIIDTDIACCDDCMEKLFVVLWLGPVNDFLSLGHGD